MTVTVISSVCQSGAKHCSSSGCRINGGAVVTVDENRFVYHVRSASQSYHDTATLEVLPSLLLGSFNILLAAATITTAVARAIIAVADIFI
jgi:hypothetical protein